MSAIDRKRHRDAAGARHLCWSCREETGAGPFCTHCVKIQPAKEMGNYFEVLGLTESYDINPSRLKKQFYELSRKFHPDFYSVKSGNEQVLARDNTAYINEALKVLSDPIRRAEYLLSLHTGNIVSHPSPPQELFEEILEAGEILDGGDLTDDKRRKLMQIESGFKARREELLESLKPLFASFLNGRPEVKKDIEARLNNIKYLRTILTRIEKTLES